jgi:hypothetical protein
VVRILMALTKDETIPARLVFETSYDGDLSVHLMELTTHGAQGLDQIYRLCKGYPPGGAQTDPASVREYLRRNSCPSAAFYAAFPERTRDDIRNAIAVYEEATRFVDQLRRNPGFDSLGRDRVWKEVVDHFREPSTLKPLRSPVTQTRLKWRAAFNLVLLLIPGVLLGIFLLLLLPIIRLYEIKEARHIPPRRYEPNPLTYDYLDLGPQNHMCTLATVKASSFRVFMVKLALRFTSVAASRIFLRGQLDAMTTIHFGRWVLLDDDKHVLFLGTFDGSWSSYIGDFSDPPHLNALWSNTERFPPTRYLLGAGARDLEAFEAHVVEEFQPTFYFHMPYERSVENILRYLQFRDALARAIARKGGRKTC